MRNSDNMKEQTEITEIDENNLNEVSVYGSGDPMDEFPVLKAFQQYIDAEQAKARKRLLTMSVFFGIMMVVVISSFVVLLIASYLRNQQLNDRLLEFAMKDRVLPVQPSASETVQQPQDNAVITALKAKIEEMQKKLSDAKLEADQKIAEAEAKAERLEEEAAKPKGPTPEELEIVRLKALLSAEKEKAAAEAEARRQKELELYRQKHYPEIYEKPAEKPSQSPVKIKQDAPSSALTDEELDALLKDDEAIEYFKDSEKESPSKQKSVDSNATPAEEAKANNTPRANNSWRIPDSTDGEF